MPCHCRMVGPNKLQVFWFVPESLCVSASCSIIPIVLWGRFRHNESLRVDRLRVGVCWPAHRLIQIRTMRRRYQVHLSVVESHVKGHGVHDALACSAVRLLVTPGLHECIVVAI